MDKLKTIVIVVPKCEVVLSSITGSLKLLNAVIEMTNAPTKLMLAGYKKNQKAFGGLFSIHTEVRFQEVDKADLIIVPSFKSDIETAINDNGVLFDWLVSQYRKGAYAASLCLGSFLLGGAGLLTHKRCTTHWQYAKEFRKLFPNAIHLKHNVITEDDRIFTSGGAFTFLNLIIYLIERFYGKEAAQWAVSVFQVDYHRDSQHQFVLFSSQKNHANVSVLKAQDFIERNYMRKLNNAEIAAHCQLGERTLVRQFKESCGNTPNEYLQRCRIEKAKEYLANTVYTIAEVQFHIGYNDPKTFRNIFSRYTSLSPSAYRKRYSHIN